MRGFHPSALPAHASAFALTVHKAQGSEFEQAWVVLPANDARTLTRELLYTALTRARRQVHLTVAEDPEMSSESLGDDFLKIVVISKKTA